ncbi:MAG: acyl-CoA/acyl-ACP dehydrogenase [Chloroflexi bacterium]|nr:acyl-CoA/acyl-ACP dehydrogenase [Chloroflexota bacterium]MDA1145900.1 acyl-CoA/acyl-ACP dehydrogenase [Chloroflexota bacterium]
MTTASPRTASVLGDSPLRDDPALLERLRAYFEPRAAEVDADRASLRDGLAFLGECGLIEVGVYGRPETGPLERMAELTAAVARFDMSQAFAIWCHRMGIEYLNQSDGGCELRETLLPRLRSGEVLGSTSFASATANYLGDVPLPVTFRRAGDGLIANGRIAWASNVRAPFVSVVAAANETDPSDRVVFAYTEDTLGFRDSGYPDLLALQATNSTSPFFEDARIDASMVLTEDFPSFFERVFATFILIQCSFCWGITERALSEARPGMTGPREVLLEDFAALEERYDSAVERLRRYASTEDRRSLATNDVLQLRLDWGRLAVEAVALESKTVGGRGYMRGSDTARRLREVAFLPVQAPTEVQLRWLLSRSA